MRSGGDFMLMGLRQFRGKQFLFLLEIPLRGQGPGKLLDLCRIERLAKIKKVIALNFSYNIIRGVIAICGHDDDLHLRIDAPDFFCGFSTVHAGHHHIDEGGSKRHLFFNGRPDRLHPIFSAVGQNHIILNFARGTGVWMRLFEKRGTLGHDFRDRCHRQRLTVGIPYPPIVIDNQNSCVVCSHCFIGSP